MNNQPFVARTFDGSTSVTAWFKHVDRVAQLNNWNSDVKLLAAQSLLTGEAESVLEDLEDGGSMKTGDSGWKQLQEALKGRFGSSGTEERYLQEWYALQMEDGETVAEYTRRFRKLSVRLEKHLTEQMKVYVYRRGLREAIKRRVYTE